jgi:hypothetical protein
MVIFPLKVLKLTNRGSLGILALQPLLEGFFINYFSEKEGFWIKITYIIIYIQHII